LIFILFKLPLAISAQKNAGARRLLAAISARWAWGNRVTSDCSRERFGKKLHRIPGFQIRKKKEMWTRTFTVVVGLRNTNAGVIARSLIAHYSTKRQKKQIWRTRCYGRWSRQVESALLAMGKKFASDNCDYRSYLPTKVTRFFMERGDHGPLSNELARRFIMKKGKARGGG